MSAWLSDVHARHALEQERHQRQRRSAWPARDRSRGSAARSRARGWAAPPCRPARSAAAAAAAARRSMIAWMLARERVDVQAAQPVVGAGLDHQHRHRLAQQPVDPPQRARRGLAAHARRSPPGSGARRRRSSAGSAPDRPVRDRARARRSGWCRETRPGRVRPSGAGGGRVEAGARRPRPRPQRGTAPARRDQHRIHPYRGYHFRTMLRCALADQDLPLRRARAHRAERYHASAWSRAGSSPSSGRPAAARRRCSACSPGSTGRRAGTVHLDGAGPRRARRGRARAAPRREGRLRVPVVPADPDAHRARERAGAARAPRRGRPRAPRRRAARARRPRRPRPPLPRPALRRRAAAGGARARVQHPAQSSSPTSPPATSTPRTGATIVELMAELNRELGTTLVLVTHDLDLAARARRTIRLADGAHRGRHRRVSRVTASRSSSAWPARESRAAPRRLLPAHRRRSPSASPRWSRSTPSPTTCATRCGDQARALLGADLALASRAAARPSARGAARHAHRRRGAPVGPASRASPRWPTCRAPRHAAGAGARRSRAAIRSTARSAPSPPAAWARAAAAAAASSSTRRCSRALDAQSATRSRSARRASSSSARS